MESSVQTSRQSRCAQLRHEVTDIFSIGISMIVTQIIALGNTMTTLFYAGRLGTAELGGIGLAVSLFDVTAFAMSNGLASACETFLSQSYGGSNRRMVGVFLQRGLVFFLMGCLVMTTININCEIFFRLLGQDPVVSCIARRFLLILTPGMPFVYLYQIMRTYLRIQDIYWPIIFSTLAGTITVVTCGYISVYVLEAGVDGIALSLALCFVVMSCSEVLYTWMRGVYIPTWPGWTLELFRDWGQYAKLSFGGAILVISDFCFIEVITVLSGTMGSAELAVQSIVFQVDALADMVHYGFSIAVAIRVGTSLGANDPEKAKRIIRLVLIIGLTASVVVAGFVALLRYPIISTFSDDPAIISLGADLLLVSAVTIVVEGTYTILNGTFRGSGRQGVASIVNLVLMYCVGVPTLVGLHFTINASLLDCWWIFSVTLAAISLVFLLMTLRTDWSRQAAIAQERIGKQERSRSENHDTGLVLEERNDETTPLIGNLSSRQNEEPRKERWRSIESMVGSVSRQQSMLSLHLPPEDEYISTPHAVRRGILILLMVILVTVTLSALNIAGVISAQELFGPKTSFLNDTMVESCRYLL